MWYLLLNVNLYLLINIYKVFFMLFLKLELYFCVENEFNSCLVS